VPRPSRWFIRTGLLHLGVGFTLGALILFHKGWALHPGLWRLLPAHMELALIGWTMNLALGVAYWSFPRFLRGAPRGPAWPAWAAYALLNAGVLAAAGGPWAGAPGWIVAAGRAAQLGAAALMAAALWPRIKPHGT
jgi:hypothetical protein